MVVLRQHRSTEPHCLCNLRPESHGVRKKRECDHPGFAMVMCLGDGPVLNVCHACGKEWEDA